MRALEIDQHMREVGTWVDWSQTVDTFKSGDPRMDVRGIAVAWQSQWPTLKAAHAAGCNLFVTHEPTRSMCTATMGLRLCPTTKRQLSALGWRRPAWSSIAVTTCGT